MRSLILRLLCCMPVLALLGLVPPATHVRTGGDTALAQDAGPRTETLAATFSDSATRKTSGITSGLDKLHRIDILSRTVGTNVTAASTPLLPADLQAAVTSGELLLDANGNVQVFAVLADGIDAAAKSTELAALGMAVEHANDEYGIVQGMLPIAALEAAAALDGVVLVRPPDRPVFNTGSVTTEGDAALDADNFRATYGADGDGVKVGVISDGIDNANLAQASGDLPASINMSCDFGPGGLPTAAGAGDEGTAMLEIVHDIAPGAELWYGHFGGRFGGTSLDFIAAVDCLALNTDVVIDDLGFFTNGLFDGTSAVSVNASTELNRATNRIRGYYNAVANHAQRHYEEPYLDSGFQITGAGIDFWRVHRYAATANTTNGGAPLQCPMPSTFLCGDGITLVAGGSVSIVMQWNDPWGNSTNDYDLLLQEAGVVLVASANLQNGAGSFPQEGFGYTNTSGATITIFPIIGNYRNTAASRTFDWFITSCSGCVGYPNGAAHNFNTTRGSVPNNSDAPGGVMSLGAINQLDVGHNDIESFSSRGPTNDGRNKPDAVAIDGVAVTGSGGFSNPFFGTSAAAPHAGAVAALLLSCKPSLKHGGPGDVPATDRTALRTSLTTSAVDLGTAGTDNTFGAGRLDADAAAAAVGCFPNADGDGCTDAEENGPMHEIGGDRNPNDPWDLYDITGDRGVDLSDTLDLLGLFGIEVGVPGYIQAFDRYAPNALKPWRTALAIDGLGIDLSDALTSLDSFGDACAPLP